MKTNIVYVRFEGCKEYPYINDKFDLAAGDKVYVDGKLAGQIGEVTEIITQFKVSLKYYKKVLQKVDMDIKGEFAKNENFFVASNNDALPFEQLFSWLQGPKATDSEEEPEEFICGDGYELELDMLDNIEDAKDDGETFIKTCDFRDAQELAESGALAFVTVKKGRGMAAIKCKRGCNIVDFDFDGDKMLMSNIFCTCISPRLCEDIIAVAYALNEAIKGLSLPRDADITLIEEELFNIVTQDKATTVIV